MDAPTQEIARRAAARLTAEFAPGLPALVERELQHSGASAPRYTGVGTAIAVAALLVSIAQFAWQMYRDLRKDQAEPAPQVLARQLRLRVEVPPQVTSANRDRLIAVVVGVARARAQLAAWQADWE